MFYLYFLLAIVLLGQGIYLLVRKGGKYRAWPGSFLGVLWIILFGNWVEYTPFSARVIGILLIILGLITLYLSFALSKLS